MDAKEQDAFLVETTEALVEAERRLAAITETRAKLEVLLRRQGHAGNARFRYWAERLGRKKT
jgi:hypothetical protein